MRDPTYLYMNNFFVLLYKKGMSQCHIPHIQLTIYAIGKKECGDEP